MSRYSLNLPAELKREAESHAVRQGVSLNQFILWALAEKLGTLKQSLDDPAFPRISYRRGASGSPAPVLRGTGIRVQTIVVAHRQWGLSERRTAEEYGLSAGQVKEALSFYEKHREEIDAAIAAEETLARAPE
jgi:uncharacterized protein (DUF433 family)